MARPRKTKTEPVDQVKSSSKNVFSQIKWGESYTSLLLGFIVVVVAAVLAFSFVKSRNIQTDVATTSTEDSAAVQVNKDGKELPKTYEVKVGEHLWSISEKIYGSGYNWVDLAKANKMNNPEIVEAGTKLNVPNVEAKVVNAETEIKGEAIKGDSYTVKEGDYLWDIAIRAYGDGYKWTDIAKVNKLSNPDYIFVGTKLSLPR